MHIEREAGLAISADAARVVLTVQQKSIERAVGDGAPYRMLHRHVFGEKIHRSAERGRPDGGGRAGAAVEVDSADPLARKEGPRVVARSIRILEGNAVPGNVVLTIL